MKLEAPDYTVLVVNDLDRAIAFYTETLGLPLGHRSGPYAQFDTGTTRLALYQREAMARTLGAAEIPMITIGFKVDDCDAAYVALIAGGAAAVVPPTDRPWGQRTAYVSDPDGHLIELAATLASPATPQPR